MQLLHLCHSAKYRWSVVSSENIFCKIVTPTLPMSKKLFLALPLPPSPYTTNKIWQANIQAQTGVSKICLGMLGSTIIDYPGG